jgi:predicted GNAT superfamily acetyltransferase
MVLRGRACLPARRGGQAGNLLSACCSIRANAPDPPYNVPRHFMTTPEIQPLHFATDSLLALNNDHSIELSPLTLAELDLLIRESFFSATINDSDALLIAFDQSSRYQHVNFLWFRVFFEKALQQNASLSSSGAPRTELTRGSLEQTANANFVYVDRVVTSPAARGKGYARALYSELFQRARSAGHTRIASEVNLDPPNPASDAFHASLNFHEVGRAAIHNNTKTVRYLLRNF